MKGTTIFAAALMAFSVPAFGQTAQPAASRRDDLRMMEGVLTTAVKNGADSLGRQMQFNEPGSLIVTGTARTRGFALDGYGVLFVVDVPMMKQSVIWSAQVRVREQTRDLLRQLVANTPDGPERREAEARLKRLDRLAAGANASPVAQPAPQGVVTAQTLPDAKTAADSKTTEKAGEETVAPLVDTRDPNELYTEAVKNALIDAMLKFGGQIIGPDEWLTIAAQDSEGPLMPGQFYDASTIMLRVKGSDLAAYHGGRMTKEEVLKKVEVREF